MAMRAPTHSLESPQGLFSHLAVSAAKSSQPKRPLGPPWKQQSPKIFYLIALRGLCGPTATDCSQGPMWSYNNWLLTGAYAVLQQLIALRGLCGPTATDCSQGPMWSYSNWLLSGAYVVLQQLIALRGLCGPTTTDCSQGPKWSYSLCGPTASLFTQRLQTKFAQTLFSPPDPAFVKRTKSSGTQPNPQLTCHRSVQRISRSGMDVSSWGGACAQAWGDHGAFGCEILYPHPHPQVILLTIKIVTTTTTTTTTTTIISDAQPLSLPPPSPLPPPPPAWAASPARQAGWRHRGHLRLGASQSPWHGLLACARNIPPIPAMQDMVSSQRGALQQSIWTV